MNKLYCSVHKKYSEITGFHRGDPQLQCGCTKHNTDYEKLDKCRNDIDRLITTKAIYEGKTIEQARNSFIDSLLLQSYAL